MPDEELPDEEIKKSDAAAGEESGDNLLSLEATEEAEKKELNPKHLIEAALFMSSRTLRLEELAGLVGIGSPGHVKNIIDELVKEYAGRDGPIIIVEEGDGFVMRIRQPYAGAVAKFAKEAEISPGALKVLAYVAQREGILQSSVVKALGTTVYEYAKELVQNGFIDAKKKGRSKSLRTTKKFQDYFSDQ